MVLEYRKLIKFGHNACVMSIPAAWLKRNNLSKGDVLFVEEIGSQLIVSAKEEQKQEEQVQTITIKDEKKAVIARKLISAYENNATTIIFTGATLYKQGKKISELVKLFTGLEIIEHTKEKIICKTYIDSSTVVIPSFIRRMDNGVKSMLKDIAEQFTQPTKSEEFKEDITERENNIDKITRLLRRVIKERLYKQQQKEGPVKLLQHWQTIVYIEEISDILEDISCVQLEQFTRKELKQTKESLQQALELFEQVMQTNYQKNTTKAHQLADIIKQKQQQIEQGLREKQHNVLMHNINQIMYLIHEINKVSY